MKIADNFVNNVNEDHDKYDYFDESDEEYDDNYIKAIYKTKDEVKTESKVPKDKFGWFYKACVITCYLN